MAQFSVEIIRRPGSVLGENQHRIIQLLVRRVTVTAEGLVIDLRTDGIAGVMREMMTPRQLEAAE
jgi:site-specific DNA recombinase